MLNGDCELYVLELSSFQLETTYSFKSCGCNYLERDRRSYGSLCGFRRLSPSKNLRIYHNAEVGVLNNEDTLTSGEDENQAKQNVSFAEKKADYWLKRNKHT